MKFVFAAASLLASTGAFAPPSQARSSTSRLSASVETPVYTFAKSEEIFKEAQEVRKDI